MDYLSDLDGLDSLVDYLDVPTPLGVVHLAGFPLPVSLEDNGVKKRKHREVIFKILSRVSGLDITALDLQESKENPRPKFPCLDFDVNWTHSGDYCVVAYGEPGVQVGVDLEKFSTRHLRLADRFFNAEESTLLHSLDDNSQMKEFFRLWCRKEALYKCVGGSFFEDSVGRSVLGNPLMAGPAGRCREVHFVDLDGGVFTNKKAAGFPAALCVAVSRIAD